MLSSMCAQGNWMNMQRRPPTCDLKNMLRIAKAKGDSKQAAQIIQILCREASRKQWNAARPSHLMSGVFSLSKFLWMMALRSSK